MRLRTENRLHRLDNYPKFRAVLEYLEQNAGEREIVRMNRHGGEETVWYFVLAAEEFHLVNVSAAW